MINVNSTSRASSGAAPELHVSLSGLFPNPSHGLSARNNDTIHAVIHNAPDPMPPVTYQWCTLESGPLSGETADSITVDATSFDMERLYCTVSVQDMPPVDSPNAVIRHASPELTTALDDQIFDEGTGDQDIPVAGIFAGQGLSYTVSSAIATFDAPEVAVVIETDTPTTGTQIALQAQNSGGSVQAVFNVIIEADVSEDMSVYVSSDTTELANPVPVSGTSIVAGNTAGHWQIIDQELTPTAAGDTADLDQGPYILQLDDSSVITVNITTPVPASMWALSSPRQDGFDIIVFDTPAGTTQVQISVNSGAWNDLGPAGPGHYVLGGLDPETAYRIDLRAFSTVPGPVSSKSISTVPQDPRGFRGWNPDIDLGTTGDIFIAPYGDDAASGALSAPLRTLSAAYEQASAGQTIKMRAGTYREIVDVKGGVTLEGFGTEKPHITASELLDGFVRCSGNDSAAIGALLGTENSPVFKTTLAKDRIEHGELLALNLFEAGRRMFAATDRENMEDLFEDLDQEGFHTADAFGTNTSDEIISITDADVLRSGRYTEDQLLAADVLLFHFSSRGSRVSITSVDLATNTITVDGLKKRQTAGNDIDRYALTNVGPQMTPGTYFIRDNGDDITLYAYPYSPINIDQIEFSARPQVLLLPSEGNDVVLRGLHTSRASGSGTAVGINILKNGLGTRTDNHVIEHVLSTGCFNSSTLARSIRLNNTGYCRLSHITCYDIMNGTAMFLNGGSIIREDGVITGGNPGMFNIISNCHFRSIGSSPLSVFHQYNMVFSHILSEKAGRGAHANKVNAYEQCHNILWWGMEFGPEVKGYLTWQEASAVNVAFSLLPIYWPQSNDHRVMVDQSNATPPPVADTQGYIFNNTVVPQVGNTYEGPAIALRNSNNDTSMTVVNNITESITSPAQALPAYDLFVGNVMTRLTYDGAPQTVADFPDGNAVRTDLQNVYADAENGDFSAIPDSPILTLAGHDMRQVIAELEPIYPQFTGFDRDYKNQPINWDILPIGADAALPFARQPILSQPVGAASSATVATGFVTTNLPQGTLYAGLWASDASPSQADIIAGTGAVYHTSRLVDASGPQGFSADGLSSGQTLIWHYLHQTGFGDTAISADEITLLSSGPSGPNLMPDPGFDDASKWILLSGYSIDNSALHITTEAVNFSSASTHAQARVPVLGNTTYEIQFDVLTATVGDRFRMHVKDYAGSALLSAVVAYDTANEGNLFTGQQVIFRVTTDPDTDALSLSFGKIGDLDVVLDNVSCRIVA